MEAKVKPITDRVLEELEKLAKDDAQKETMIICWAELQQGKWPSVIPTDLPNGEQPSKTTFAAVGAWIIKKVGRYHCSKYWNCVHLGSMTEKEFDSFWTKTYNKATKAPRLAEGIKHKPEANQGEPTSFDYEVDPEALEALARPDTYDDAKDGPGAPLHETPPQPAKKKKKSKKKKKTRKDD